MMMLCNKLSSPFRTFRIFTAFPAFPADKLPGLHVLIVPILTGYLLEFPFLPFLGRPTLGARESVAHRRSRCVATGQVMPVLVASCPPKFMLSTPPFCALSSIIRSFPSFVHRLPENGDFKLYCAPLKFPTSDKKEAL